MLDKKTVRCENNFVSILNEMSTFSKMANLINYCTTILPPPRMGAHIFFFDEGQGKF